MQQKPVRFTRHARNRMRKEEVGREVVEVCIRSPESITESIKGRRNYWRRHEEGYLRVTIADEEARAVVVTVTVRRRGAKE